MPTMTLTNVQDIHPGDTLTLFGLDCEIEDVHPHGDGFQIKILNNNTTPSELVTLTVSKEFMLEMHTK